MAERAIIIGQAKDLAGCWWDIRERRPTSHGFDLFFGWPESVDGAPSRGKGFGGPRLVPTRALYRYWRSCRMRRDGSIYDLPIGRSTAKRVRGLMRYDDYEDYHRWWAARAGDLRTLTLEAFAARHGVFISQVSVARQNLISSAPVSPSERARDW